MTMQSHLLVGPISIAAHATAADSNYLSAAPRRQRYLLVSAASSSSTSAINGGGDHYTLLGVTRSADAVEIKRAYRLLARKYHPDVSKDSHASELFKSIRHAYEVLSDETTRFQYDRELQSSHKPYQEKWSYSTDFEDEVRRYRWAYMRKKMRSERYWEHYNINEDYYSSETDEKEDEENLNEDRGSFIEVIRSAFLSLLLFQTLGSQLSLTFSSLTALFDRKLDAGYKVGYVIAWILGGRGGVILTLFLSFASWVFGKTSSSVVALFMVAMWVDSSLSSYAPLPQGALLTLIYMSIKLQSDQI